MGRRGGGEREHQSWQPSRPGQPTGSRLLQLDVPVSNVEAAHILVGALEASGDVLIHGAVIQVQALG